MWEMSDTSSEKPSVNLQFLSSSAMEQKHQWTQVPIPTCSECLTWVRNTTLSCSDRFGVYYHLYCSIAEAILIQNQKKRKRKTFKRKNVWQYWCNMIELVTKKIPNFAIPIYIS
jgi:hypothetical protein